MRHRALNVKRETRLDLRPKPVKLCLAKQPMERDMDLREALTQISEIRQQVARTETFRGYRAAPVAFSGVVAWTAALCQYAWMPSPANDPLAYLSLWVGAALLSMVVA